MIDHSMQVSLAPCLAQAVPVRGACLQAARGGARRAAARAAGLDEQQGPQRESGALQSAASKQQGPERALRKGSEPARQARRPATCAPWALTTEAVSLLLPLLGMGITCIRSAWGSGHSQPRRQESEAPAAASQARRAQSSELRPVARAAAAWPCWAAPG